MDAEMRPRVALSMLRNSIDLLNDALEYVDEGTAKEDLKATLDIFEIAIDNYKGELQ